MSEQRVIEGTDGLRALAGEQVGATDWMSETQDKEDRYAEATGDDQWIHVDPERAAVETDVGGTIAHGYLTLSLVNHLLPQVVEVTGISMGINYGLDRLRFPAPVPVGAKVRGVVAIDEVTEVAGGVQTAYTITFEIDGADKPACVARFLERRFL